MKVDKRQDILVGKWMFAIVGGISVGGILAVGDIHPHLTFEHVDVLAHHKTIYFL